MLFFCGEPPFPQSFSVRVRTVPQLSAFQELPPSWQVPIVLFHPYCGDFFRAVFAGFFCIVLSETVLLLLDFWWLIPAFVPVLAAAHLRQKIAAFSVSSGSDPGFWCIAGFQIPAAVLPVPCRRFPALSVVFHTDGDHSNFYHTADIRLISGQALSAAVYNIRLRAPDRIQAFPAAFLPFSAHSEVSHCTFLPLSLSWGTHRFLLFPQASPVSEHPARFHCSP